MARTLYTFVMPRYVPVMPGFTQVIANPGETATIRHIHVLNLTPDPVNFYMSLLDDTSETITDPDTRIFSETSIAGHGTLDHYCQYTLTEDNLISAGASADSVLVITVVGHKEPV